MNESHFKKRKGRRARRVNRRRTPGIYRSIRQKDKKSTDDLTARRRNDGEKLSKNPDFLYVVNIYDGTTGSVQSRLIMSTNALGTESPVMKRRWAAVGHSPKTSERPSLYELLPIRSEEKHKPTKTRNKQKMTTSTMTTVVERVVISSYAETPAYFPMQRTLSEVDESTCSDEGDDGSDEDHPSTSDVTTRGNKIPVVFPQLTPPKLLMRCNDRSDLESPTNTRTSCESQCFRKRSTCIRLKKTMEQRMPQLRVILGILFVLVISITPFVLEPTNYLLCDSFKNNTSLPIEKVRQSCGNLSASPKIPHEILRKSTLSNEISTKEKMERIKQRIHTIASSVGASTLATIGSKIGSELDIRIATVNIELATCGTIIAKIELFISRILPNCLTIGTAMGASFGALIGLKVANFMQTNA